MKANIKTIFFLSFFLTVSFLQCYGWWCDFLDLPHLLSSKPNDYTLEYDGLRGSVKSVTIYEGKIVRDYGKETLVKGDILDSIVYSPSKLRKEWFLLGHINESVCTCYYMGIDRIDRIEKIKGYGSGRTIINFVYIGNDSIVERCGEAQTEYKLLPNGYRFVHYRNKAAAAEHFSFQKNGTKGEIECDMEWSNHISSFDWICSNASLDFDSHGRLTKIVPKKGYTNIRAFEIEYDRLGNVVKLTRSNNSYTLRRTRNGLRKYKNPGDTIKAQYEYDSNGNWIKLRVDERGERGVYYYFRDIEYYTDEELAEWNISDQKKAREELLARITESAKSYCKSYAQKKNEQYLDALAGWRTRYDKDNRSDSLVGFDLVDDIYSFRFSDGSSVNNVKFTHTSYGNERLNSEISDYKGAYFISEDMRVVLAYRYDDITLEPQCYVGLYNDNVKYEIVPDTSKDWRSVFVDKYGFRDDVSEEDLNELWQEELDRQYKSSFRNYIESLQDKRRRLIINQIPNPYDNGFVSPSISDKSKEKELLEKLKMRKEKKREQENKRKEQEKREKILDFVHLPFGFGGYIGYNNYNKRYWSDFIVPDDIKVEKLRSFEINGDKYSFTKKDKTVISEKKFTNSLVSDDNTIVIVIQVDGVYIFELDGNVLKSVNLIPTKQLKGFIMPDGSTL